MILAGYPKSSLIFYHDMCLDCLHEVLLYTREEAVHNGPHVGHNF